MLKALVNQKYQRITVINTAQFLNKFKSKFSDMVAGNMHASKRIKPLIYLWIKNLGCRNTNSLTHLANSASCLGSERSIPGMPPGGSFFPVMYSE